jgi:uncharacterized protein
MVHGACSADDPRLQYRLVLRRIVLTAVAALVLAGAAMPSQALAQVRSLIEMRTDRVVLQQWDISCAAAALATILNHQHGDPVTERQIALTLIQRPEYIADPELVRRRQGFSLLDLKRYVDARGYQGTGFGRLRLADLEARAPIMVPIDTYGYNHFVVFRGRHGNRVMLADPAFGNRTMTVERFMGAWIDFPGLGHVGFVVERRDGRALPNRLAPSQREFMMLR